MEVPLVLDASNIGEYFARAVLPKLPEGARLVGSEEITENTFVNWVFAMHVQVDGEPETLYIRQSRDYVKEYQNLARDPKRCKREAAILNYLGGIVPGAVPEVINLDEQNNTLVLSDIRRGGNLLAEELAAGRLPEQAVSKFGEIIGRIQTATFGKTLNDILGPDAPKDTSMATFLGSRTEPAEKHFPQELARLLADSEAARHCLVLGDLAPKNVFVEGADARFLDLERSSMGDPAYDPAYVICHLLIDVAPELRQKSLEVIGQFVDSYLDVVSEKLNAAELAELQNRIIRYTGMSILHRTQGTHFATYAGNDVAAWQSHGGTLMNTASTNILSALAQIV